jgi:hypothetical protein
MNYGEAVPPDPVLAWDSLVDAFNSYVVDREASLAFVAVGSLGLVIGGGLEVCTQIESPVPVVMASFGVVSLFGGACANAISEVRFRRAVNRL